MSLSIEQVCTTLAEIAPLRLAESWDNVGLLVGDRTSQVERVLTCLTITPEVVDEAISEKADLIVTHHPLPFKPFAKLTADSIPTAMVLKLVHAGIAVYSAHTAFDSASDGINAQWANTLGIVDPKPLLDSAEDCEQSSSDGLGAGRYGQLGQTKTLQTLAIEAAQFVSSTHVRMVGDETAKVQDAAIACGSGGSFLAAAHRRGCDALMTGEATFHTCLEAKALGINLVLLGHYHSERFAMERLADQLAQTHPNLTVWPSHSESNPVFSIRINDTID